MKKNIRLILVLTVLTLIIISYGKLSLSNPNNEMDTTEQNVDTIHKISVRDSLFLKKDKFSPVLENDTSNKSINIDSLFSELSSVNLPYSSKNVLPKVRYSENIGGYVIDIPFFNKISNHMIDWKNPMLFFNDSVKNINLSIHKSNARYIGEVLLAYENLDDYNYNVNSQVLLPFFKLKKGNINIIGSYSQYHGENGIPGVFFIITSFDDLYNQLDFLIVFERFSWELSSYIDFVIEEDYTINLTRSTVQHFDDNLENELKVPIETKQLENYFLTDNGIFEKIESKSSSVDSVETYHH